MNKCFYPYLRDTLTDFVKITLDSSKAVPALREALEGRHWFQKNPSKPSFRKLCQELGISQSEFGKTFWEPWNRLTPAQVTEVAKYLNMGLISEKGLLMEILPVNGHRALQWTLVNVNDIHLFDVFREDYNQELAKAHPNDLITEIFIAPDYSMPYRQCRFCGRLETDPREKPFGKGSLAYCHLSDCQSYNPNPSQHMPGCCAGDWQRIKRNIRRRCSDSHHDPSKVIQKFQESCQERFQANLKIQTPVQVKREKPEDWRLSYDALAISVYKKDYSLQPKGLPLF